MTADEIEYDSVDFARERAAELGLVVCLPGQRELQIDIDSDAAFAVHERSWEVAQRMLGLSEKDRRITPSRNGGEGRHIRVDVGFELDPWQRLTLQAAMGSDPVRELLGAGRVLLGSADPSLFFETPEMMETLR